jgi:Crinkler effector protein N-terminal domain
MTDTYDISWYDSELLHVFLYISIRILKYVLKTHPLSLRCRYTGIMVYCFVVGTRIDNSFSLTENKDISGLKEIIFDKNKNLFESLDANRLSLWKVDIPWESDELRKLEPLETRSPDENTTIAGLGGELLLPYVEVSDIFKQDSKNIRIIVQPPSVATTTTGKCLPMVYLTRNSRYL